MARLGALALALALQPLERVLAASNARAVAVLATEPWPDAASRDVRAVAAAEMDRLDAELAAAERALETARAVRRDLAAKLRTVDRMATLVGIRTEPGGRAHDAAVEVEHLQVEWHRRRADHRHRQERAEADARQVVAARERERRIWTASPAVERARRELEGNRLVRDAAIDPMIRARALQDLGAVRAVLLQREQRTLQEARLPSRSRTGVERSGSTSQHVVPPRQP